MEGVGSPSFTGARFSEFMVYPDAQFAVDDLNSGAVDALAIRTASFGPLAKDLTTLPDDDHVYPAQNVVPLYRTGVLDESAVKSFSVVAGELTTADLADMIGEVRGGAASGDVAGRWLGEHSL
jgi:osmoprotectant transport system substrate-binding protein